MGTFWEFKMTMLKSEEAWGAVAEDVRAQYGVRKGPIGSLLVHSLDNLIFSPVLGKVSCS